MNAKKNPVGWFEIYVQDLSRAKKFYETVLKTRLESLPSPTVELLAFPMERNASGCPGALVKMQGKDSGSGGTLIYFSCDEDCAKEAALAAKNGGSIVKEKSSIGEYGFISLVKDTEGNIFGLHSMK